MSGVTVAQLQLLIDATNKAGPVLSSVSSQLNSMGQQATRTGTQMSLALTAPLVAIGGAALKLGSDYEASMSKIAGLTDSTREEVEQMKTSVLDMSRQMPQSAKELSDGLFFVVSAGQKGAAALETLQASAHASAAGLGETKVIANAVTSALNAYQEGADRATHYTDLLTNAVVQGKMEPAALAESLGRVLPVAAASGVSFEQVAASMATMTRVGLNADEAATAIRGTLAALEKPGKAARDALAEIGLSADGVRQSIRDRGLLTTLQDLMDRTQGNIDVLGVIIPNIRALTGVLATAGSQGQVYAQILDSMNHAEGRTAKAFEEASGTMEFQLGRLKNAIEADLIQVAQGVIPRITPFLTMLGTEAPAKIEALIHAFESLPKPVQEGIVAFVGLVAAAGPMLLLGGKLLELFAALATPMGLWTLAIAATAAALITLYRNSEDVRAQIDIMILGAREIAQLFGFLAGVVGLLPTPVLAVAAALGILTAAVILFETQPIIATLTTLAGVALWVAGQIGLLSGEHDRAASAAQREAAANKQLADSMEEISDRKQALSEATADVSKLVSAIESGGASSTEVVTILRSTLESLVPALLAAWDGTDKLTKGQVKQREEAQAIINFIEKMGGEVKILGDGTVEVTGDIHGLTSASRQLQDAIEAATPRILPFQGALTEMAKAAKEGKDQLATASKIVTDFANQVTGAEQVLTRQQHALDLVGSAMQAAFSAGNIDKAHEWAQVAHDAADKADLSAAAHQRLNREIDAVATTTGTKYTGALDTLKKDLDGLKSPMADQSKAMSEQRQLAGDVAKEQLGLAGSMQDLKTAITQLVDSLLLSMGKVPPALQEVVTKTKEGFQVDYSKEGAAAAETYIKGLSNEKVTLVNQASDMARAVRTQMHIDLSGEGAAAVGSLARGIGSMEGALSFAVGRIRGIMQGLSQIPVSMPAAVASIGNLANIDLSNLDPITAKSPAPVTRGLQQIQQEAPAAARAIQQLGDGAASLSDLKDQIGQASALLPGFTGVVEPAVASLSELKDQLKANGTEIVSVDDAIRQMGAGFRGTHDYLLQFGIDLDHLGETAQAVGAPSGPIGLAALSARQMTKDVAGIDVAIAQLKVQLTETAAFSKERQEIETQIQFLEGWKAKYDAVAASRKALDAQRLANMTGGDFFTERQGQIDQAASLTKGYGAPGASIIASVGETLKDPANGAKLADAVNTLLTSDAFKHLAGAHDLGLTIIDLAAQAASGDSAAFAELLSVLGQVNTQLTASTKLSADTFLAARNDVQQQADLVAQLGSQMASGYDAMVKAAKDGGAQNIQATAKWVGDTFTELRRLPEFVRGQLGTEFNEAVGAYIAAPTEEGARRVQDASRHIHEAIEIIPQSFEKLPAPIRQSITQLVQAAEDGAIGVTQAKERVSQALQLLPADFRKLDAVAQESITNIVQGWLAGAVTFEQATDQIAKAAEDAAKRVKAAADAMQNSLYRGVQQGQTQSFQNDMGGGTTTEETADAFGIPGFTRVVVKNRSGFVVSDNGAFYAWLFGKLGADPGDKDWHYPEQVRSAIIAAQLKASTSGNPASPDYDPGYRPRGMDDGQWHGEGTPHAAGGVFDRPTWMWDAGGQKHVFGEAGSERLLSPGETAAYQRGAGGGIDYDRLAATLAGALDGRPVVVQIDGRQVGAALVDTTRGRY